MAAKDKQEPLRQDRELQEQWRAAFEANPTMYFIVDQAGAIVSVNPFGAQQLGYAVSELVGKPVLDVFYGPDRAFVGEKAASCFTNLGSTLRWEARQMRKDGKMLWVRETANAVMLRSRPVLLVACEDVTEQKRTEQALRESEERFRTLMKFSFDVYWETDAQHRFVRQEYDTNLLDPPGPQLGKTRWEIPHLEPDEEAWRRHRETCDAHLPFRDFELARPMPDGGKRYVSVSGLPVFDDTGRFVGYRGVGRHITERKRAEETLRQREKELRDIIETMPAMAFVTDAGGRNAKGNGRWDEYTGLGRDAANSRAAIHPDDAARYGAARRHSIATGEPFEQEVRLRRFDGEYRWFLGRAVPLHDEQGNILKWYGVHTDIHDRKMAEEERAAHLWTLESMDRINRAMQGNNDLERMMSDVLDAVLEVFACDRAWLVYPCDPDAPSWRAVMEHTRPQFPGAFALGTDMAITPDVAHRFRAACAAEGAVVFGSGYELPVPGPAAERLATRSLMAMAVRPKVDRAYLFGLHQCSHARVWSEQERRLFEEIGRRLDDALTSLLIFRSLRDAEAALVRVNRVTTLGVLAASIAHEVNQPLGAITASAAACTRWLAMQPPEMEKARAALQRITMDGRRAGQVVDRIRALVNRQAPRRDCVDINEAILEVIALTRNEVRQKEIALETSLAPDVPLIEGDRVQLQQVVLNLLVNAIEAMSGIGEWPRELAIGSARDGPDTVTVEVRDSGPGVDPGRLDRLFEAFYSTKDNGIGMGLSISRSIIETHGGRLWVTPNVSRGATFRFSLPASGPAS